MFIDDSCLTLIFFTISTSNKKEKDNKSIYKN